MTSDELDWLATERPARALTATATARARTALLDHIDDEAPVRLVASPVPPQRRRSRLLGLATVAVAAAAAVVAISSLGGGGGSSLGTPNADAAPLVQLSHKVSQASPPTGDATLVEHTNTLADGTSFTGADLYADDGDYFYAETRAGLPAVVAADQPVDVEGSIARELAAAIAAVDGPLAESRSNMAIAPLDPAALKQSAAAVAAQQQTLVQLARAKAAVKAKGGSWADEQQTPEQKENGDIWSSSLDALIAGSGNPEVRAGVLRLLSTIPTVTVEHTVTDGRPTLQLTAHVFPQQYEEQLVIDADTGTPIQFIGTDPGQKPGVVVDYTVSRVTLAEIAKG
ncbi:MAG TPA: hypothetical protein VGF46_04245 [Gaiellales bacterium]